jgi:sugar O-acyltransferase (sialic acid O-acetyltransferase NeuD family)
MKPLLIYGAGGLGRQVAEIVRQQGHYGVAAWLDGNPDLHGQVIEAAPVLGDHTRADAVLRSGISHAVVAVGCNATRAALAERLAEAGFTLATIIHPSAAIATSATIEPHVVIGARAMICVHASIGAHAIIATGAIVEHDNRIGRAAFLEPAVRLAGTVTVEVGARVGIGACVIPGRTIGARAEVAPGAIVTRDVRPETRVHGQPARAVGVVRKASLPADDIPLAPKQRWTREHYLGVDAARLHEPPPIVLRAKIA